MLERGARGIVGHQCGAVELEALSQLFDRGFVVSSLETPLDFVVLLDDLVVNNSQIVVSPLHTARHLDRGPNGRRAHRHTLDYHIGGIGLFLVQTEHLQVLRSDFLQNLACLLWPHQLLAIIVGSLLAWILNLKLYAERDSLVVVVQPLACEASFDGGTKFLDAAEPGLGVGNLSVSLELDLVTLVVAHQVRAIEAHRLQYLPNVVQQVGVVNRSEQLNVTKVTWAVDLGAHASFADAVHVHCAESVVVNTVRLGVSVVLIDKRIVNGCDSLVSYFIRGHHR